MASHFSTIGMPVESGDDIVRLVDRLDPESERIAIEPLGYCLAWRSKSGAGVWSHIVRENRSEVVVGANPFFVGGEFLVKIMCAVRRKDDNDFEGSFYAWAAPDTVNNKASENDQETANAEGLYPFVFECVNFAEVSEIKLPKTTNIKLAAFAHSIDLYESEADYDAAQTDSPKYAAQSFFPSGLFHDEAAESQPFAMFSGIILESERLTNEATNRDFYRIKVDTYGGAIDVIADPELILTQPKIGGVLRGDFYLCGFVEKE